MSFHKYERTMLRSNCFRRPAKFLLASSNKLASSIVMYLNKSHEEIRVNGYYVIKLNHSKLSVYDRRIWKCLIRYSKETNTNCLNHYWLSLCGKIIEIPQINYAKDGSCEKQNFCFINQTLSSELRLHDNIHGITNNLEQDSEVKVTEDDLGLVKYIIEQSIQSSTTIDELRQVMTINNDPVIEEFLLKEIQFDNETAELLYFKLTLIEFPASLLKSFSSCFFLTETQGLLLVVEYVKFHILNYMFPEVCVPSQLLREFFYDHICYNIHFNSFCQNIFQTSEEKCQINKWSKEMYIETLKLYKKIYGSTPPDFIWKCAEEEQACSFKPLLQINLVRLTIYSLYEKFICKEVKYSKFLNKRIEFEEIVDLEKFMNTESKSQYNIMHKYFFGFNRKRREDKYRNNCISKLKWRK